MVCIVKVGKNLRVLIPRDIATKLHIKPADYLAVKVKEDENLLIYEKVEIE